MFERYVPQSRRAIYFAAVAALNTNSAVITSEHLLFGLMHEAGGRANVLFELCECFPDLVALQKQFRPVSPLANQHELTQDSKRILAYAAKEASRLADFWIDAEHLVLGILREHSCPAALRLNKASINLQNARRIVTKNKSSRPITVGCRYRGG